ncbi:MAG: glycosyltransferase family 2 protein [Candidatus Algichlamydia australiensis]|nr:glycosyltransferase family 2 protein [Chlamydiales bacterium]
MISVVILNWNGKNDTLACLQSLDNADYQQLKTYVVDNGSTDNSIQAIQAQFPNVELIETGENLGFAGGNNVALRKILQTETDYIFLLNNDTVVRPDIFKSFVARAEKEPNSVWGGKLCLYDLPDTLDHLGGIWDEKHASFRLVGNREKSALFSEPIEMDYICGAALFAPKRVFEKVGLLEEKYFLVWEEADWCTRAKRAGFKMLLCPEATLFHKVSASFQDRAHQSYFSFRNRLLFIERNFELKERCKYLFRIFTKEVSKNYKHYQIRLFTRRVGIALRRDKPERAEKIKKLRARLCAFRDYTLRRFGNCPNWLYKK